MRHLKVLGIAVLAAFSLAAFVGATTASATRLCSTNTTPCANVYPNDTTFTAHLQTGTPVVVTTSGGSVQPALTCSSSTMGVTTTNSGGGAGLAVTAKLNALSFTNCSGSAGCNSSFQVGSLAGTNGVITSTTGMDGTVQFTPPLIGFTCTLFAGLQIPCTFGGSGTLDATVTGGNPAVLAVRNQTMAAITSFGCPTSSTWNATYQTTNALFVSAS